MRSDIQRWSAFYSNRTNFIDIIRNLLTHIDYIFTILMIFSHKSKYVLEVGVGTGTHTFFLSKCGACIISIDNNQEIVKKTNSLKKNGYKPPYFIICDAYYLPFKNNTFDICISQGFYEHFEDIEIRKLLDEQYRVSKMIVFSVPSNNYIIQSVGNERLMKPSQWETILYQWSEYKKIERIYCRYYRIDFKAIKDSILNGKWLGFSSILCYIERQNENK